MSRLLIRHAVSAANDSGNPAFGRPDAGLLDIGREQARGLGPTLLIRHNINPWLTRAATSEFTRTQETAAEAGIALTKPYAILNEVEHGMELSQLQHMLRIERKVPAAALVQAEVILEKPPVEPIWFTHGLVMLGLYEALGLERDTDERFVPNFCEIVELPID